MENETSNECGNGNAAEEEGERDCIYKGMLDFYWTL